MLALSVAEALKAAAKPALEVSRGWSPRSRSTARSVGMPRGGGNGAGPRSWLDLARTMGTRDPEGSMADDVVTVGNDAGSTAAETTVDAGLPIGGPPVATTCAVASGPAYSPSGTIPVVNAGGRKRAPFRLDASFVTDGPNGKAPACCSVRQFIKWDSAFANWRGGPPHSGFPSSSSPNTWIEDRDTSDKRYGWRAGPHSDPQAGCGDEYKTGRSQDMANGDTYCGRDTPSGPADMTGQWQFRQDVVDTCTGATKARSTVITINW